MEQVIQRRFAPMPRLFQCQRLDSPLILKLSWLFSSNSPRALLLTRSFARYRRKNSMAVIRRAAATCSLVTPAILDQGRHQQAGAVELFPGEIFAAKVTAHRRAGIDRPLQVQLCDDPGRGQVERRLHRHRKAVVLAE